MVDLQHAHGRHLFVGVLDGPSRPHLCSRLLCANDGCLAHIVPPHPARQVGQPGCATTRACSMPQNGMVCNLVLHVKATAACKACWHTK